MTRCLLKSQLGTDIDLLGLPQLPDIPQIVLCLNFPGSEGWTKHWTEFNKKVKDFRQAMIDFNWKILEWYSLKSKQLERFGMKTLYVAGTLVSSPRMTVIFTKITPNGDVTTTEVKINLPDAVKKDMISLEKTGFKLCLPGKIFIFNRDKVIVVDYDRDANKSLYRNCLKFTLYDKNEKVNIFETYNRIYGGLRYSFIMGGIGGLLVSLLTGYYDMHHSFNQHQKTRTDQNLMWLIGKRGVSSSIVYTLIERVLLLELSGPKRYALSGATGATCGFLFGLLDNCDPVHIMYATLEFGIYSVLCNIFMSRQRSKTTGTGKDNFY